MKFLINLIEKIKAFYSFHRERKTLPPWVFICFSKIFSFICFIFCFAFSKIKDFFLFHKERKSLPMLFLSIPWFFIAGFCIFISMGISIAILFNMISNIRNSLINFNLSDLDYLWVDFKIGFIMSIGFFPICACISFFFILYSVNLLKLSSDAFKTCLSSLTVFTVFLFNNTASLLGNILIISPAVLVLFLPILYLLYIKIRDKDLPNPLRIFSLHKEKKTLLSIPFSLVFLILGVSFLLCTHFWTGIENFAVDPADPMDVEQQDAAMNAGIELLGIALFLISLFIWHIWIALGLLFSERYTVFLVLLQIIMVGLSFDVLAAKKITLTIFDLAVSIYLLKQFFKPRWNFNVSK